MTTKRRNFLIVEGCRFIRGEPVVVTASEWLYLKRVLNRDVIPENQLPVLDELEIQITSLYRIEFESVAD